MLPNGNHGDDEKRVRGPPSLLVPARKTQTNNLRETRETGSDVSAGGTCLLHTLHHISARPSATVVPEATDHMPTRASMDLQIMPGLFRLSVPYQPLAQPAHCVDAVSGMSHNFLPGQSPAGRDSKERGGAGVERNEQAQRTRMLLVHRINTRTVQRIERTQATPVKCGITEDTRPSEIRRRSFDPDLCIGSWPSPFSVANTTDRIVLTWMKSTVTASGRDFQSRESGQSLN